MFGRLSRRGVAQPGQSDGQGQGRSVPGQLAHRDAVFSRNGLRPSAGSQANAGYDAVANQYRQDQADPYADLAAREREMGYRHPSPYAAVAAAAVEAGVRFQEPARRSPLANMPDLSGGAIYDPLNIAGQRGTMFGTHGWTVDPNGLEIWSARQFAGMQASGGRDPNVVPQDVQDGSGRRVSGRMTNGETMSQRVPKGRPWLVLRTTESAMCKVTAMMSGGFEQERTFWIGGGSTASFLLNDYESAAVEVLGGTSASTVVQFAWVSEGMQAGNQDLYLPEVIAASGFDGSGNPLFVAVPEGAYQVSPATTDALWLWDQPGVTGYQNAVGVSAGGAASGSTRNPVNGSRYHANVANSLMWILRPI